MAGDGVLRRIYSGVYTSVLDLPLESVVLRNWGEIASHLLPGGVVSFRSAREGRPVDGRLYITRGRTPRTIEMPGLNIRVVPGKGAVTEGSAQDAPYKSLFMASEVRWLLENMAAGKGVAERVLSREEVERYLDRVLLLRGELRFNELRDNCRQLAERLDLQKAFGRLDKIMGALLGTHEARRLRSHQALARAAGKPYDPERIELFDALFAHLKSNAMPGSPIAPQLGKLSKHSRSTKPISPITSKARPFWWRRPSRSSSKAR